MGKLSAQVFAQRALRNEARAQFDARLAGVKQDLDARGIGGRIADRVADEAVEAVEAAIELADENRGLLAGSIAALAIWLLRNPIISWIDSKLAESDPGESETDEEEHQDHD